MHERLTAIVGLLSLAAILLIGFWFHLAELSTGLWVFSLGIVGAVVLSTGLFIASVDGPFMGLTERISAAIGFLWDFILARGLYLNDTDQMLSTAHE